MRDFLKKGYPNMYHFIVFTPSLLDQGIGEQKAIKRVLPDRTGKLIINLGSGVKQLGDGILNVDRAELENVDIIADAAKLPWADGLVDMVLCVSLLEHVLEPRAVIKEVTRVLRPGGYFYVSIPFIYPFHSSPSDYTRLTKEGLLYQLRDFEVIQQGCDSGPITALLIQFSYIIAIAFSFNSEMLFDFILNSSMIVLAPFRIFDFLLCLFPKAHYASASLYFLGKKKVI